MAKIRVFISSKQAEFKPERAAMFEILEASGYAEAVLAEDWSPQRQNVRDTFLEQVSSCPIYVGLFGRIYSEPTEAEYRKARENPGREVLIYVKDCAERDAPLQSLVAQLNDPVAGHTIRVYATWEELRPFFLRHIRDAVDRMIGLYLKLAHGSSRGPGGGWSVSARRQLAAMRAIGLPEVESPKDAEAHADELRTARDHFRGGGNADPTG